MTDFHYTGTSSLTSRDLVLQMAIIVFFLLSLIGLASSALPHKRLCDAVEERDLPTLCSNYKNIEALYGKKAELSDTVQMLDEMVNWVTQMAQNNSIFLEQLAENLTHSLADLTNVTENQQSEINHLKREVSKLVRHKNDVRGNFHEIEQRLELTENELNSKKAKLENLENQTEAAFNETRRLLSLYKSELSKLNTTARDLEDKVGVRLNATKTDLDDELKKIQQKNAAFSDRLRNHEVDFSHLKRHTNSRFGNVNQWLETQNLTVNLLKNETADLANKLGSIQNIQTEVKTKVAFSATIIESSHVFTGPRTPGGKSVLIFDKIFTNIGNAYNKNTGTFRAPVKGVYQFTFMTFGYQSHSSGAILTKNGHYQVSTWEFTGTDVSDTTSNTVILDLNPGDCVNIILWQGGKIHTSVFSGFLIFPIT